ncbi:MAG: YHS domain-containing protein [Candidatus Thorarchaeota archaeon]
MEVDPVSGMKVDEKTTKFTSEYDGKTYYFCLEMCKKEFDEDPSKYLTDQ